MAKPKLLDYEGVSELIHVQVPAVRTMLAKARAHRAEGKPRPGDLPEPDRTIGRSPVWEEATIRAWIKRRPGQGAAGGVKRSAG